MEWIDKGVDGQLLFSLVILAGAFVAMRYLPRLMAGVPFLDAHEIQRRLLENPDIVVVDVRTTAEFTGDLGHMSGAVNLPLGDLIGRLRSLDSRLMPFKNHPVVVACRTDSRAAQAVRVLKQAGFSNLVVLKGGMKAWHAAGMPVEGRSHT